jgi:protein-tyrosine-phosphatase
MAEVLLRARLARDEERHDWQVGSAGVWAADGQPASAYAVEEMAQRGIDLNAHRSRNVTREMMAEADLVLAMTRHHAEALRAAFPEYGGTRLEYSYIARELEQLIEAGYEYIVWRALVEREAGD